MPSLNMNKYGKNKYKILIIILFTGNFINANIYNFSTDAEQNYKDWASFFDHFHFDTHIN